MRVLVCSTSWEEDSMCVYCIKERIACGVVPPAKVAKEVRRVIVWQST